jgi:DNA-binding NtrC family response regulator
MTEPSSIDPLPPAVRQMLARIAQLALMNPFDPRRLALARAVVPYGLRPERLPGDELLDAQYRLLDVVSRVADRIGDPAVASPEDLAMYRAAAIYALWDEHRDGIQALVRADGVEVPFWDKFVATYGRLRLDQADLGVPAPGHLLALMVQWWRNVAIISKSLPGNAPCVVALRVAVFRANMGPDLCTYAAGLYRCMDEIPVLITGETGTGKERVATCIGQGGYIPFDEQKRCFVMPYRTAMHVKNLSTVPHDLLASELFGQKRGSFTGATADRVGLFAIVVAYGSLFLDEIGEIPEWVQVMLLRPLENREIVAVGDTQPREILGRAIFATHQDLEAKCAAGEFRADLLERMNGVRIHLPPLRNILAESPEELWRYVKGFLTDRKITDAARRDVWTQQIVTYIRKEMAGHGWTRNLRELRHLTERFLLSEGTMPKPKVVPAPLGPVMQAASAEEEESVASRAPMTVAMPSSGFFGPRAKRGELQAEDLLRAYVTEVYVLNDMNLAETARITGLDWRTVRKLIDHERVARLLARRGEPAP